MLRGAIDPGIEERDVVGVDGVDIGAAFGDGDQVGREAGILGGERSFAFAEALSEVAEVDVEVRGAADARTDSVEEVREGGGEGVFEVWGQGLLVKFFDEGERGLFAPDGEFLHMTIVSMCWGMECIEGGAGVEAGGERACFYRRDR